MQINSRTLTLEHVLALAQEKRLIVDSMHGERHACPVCQENLQAIALTKLAYTFETCRCRHQVGYDHLIQQLWHKRCLVTRLLEEAGVV